MTLPYRPGQFVWCRFPQHERPDKPGPKLRIGYLATVRQVEQGLAVAIIYTTTRPFAEPLPLGVIPIAGRVAEALSQRPFWIDARCIAYLPVTIEYFPRLDRTDHGVQGLAPIGLQRKIVAAATEVFRRPELLDLRGPGRS